MSIPAELNSARRRQRWTRIGMQGPSLIILALVLAFPLGYSIMLSLQSYSPVDPTANGQWIGLDNYLRMFQDAQFGQAILVTVGYVICAVSIQTVLGTAIGVWLSRLIRTRRLVTSLLLLPMISTPLVVGLMFSFGLNPQFGYMSDVLQTLGLVGQAGVLDSGAGAFVALVVMDVWEWTPFIALMVLAGLSAAPQAQIQAAELDGCNTLQLYWHVMLPMIRPVIGVAILFRATEAIRMFDQVYILTGGGPGSATTVNDIFQYRVSFTAFDMSYGAALGIATFVAVALLAWVLFRYLNRRSDS
ncbi:MAG: carbohydrate ABC transporter permease [Beutenbergiaceae bacterium]